MFSLIRGTIDARDTALTASDFTADGIEKLYKLSKAHDMVHLVGQAMMKFSSDFSENEYLPKFKKQYMLAFLRYEKQRYVYDELVALFEEEKIPFIPLKGSVLRDYYPEGWMRTSCDIDILVHEEDAERAKNAILTKLGYRYETDSAHDVGFFAPNGTHFELHRSLIESNVLPSADKPLERVWEYATPVSGKTYHYALSPEMFYYYHIAHMAKHFVKGGCGLRPFLDIRIYRQKQPLDEALLFALLEEGSLSAFAKASEKLSAVWFLDDTHTAITASMERYLLDAGVYGNMSNLVAMQQSKKGGKTRYLLSRIFTPYASLSALYPSLKKHKWAYPFYLVRRWFRILFGGRFKRAMKEVKHSSATTNEALNNAESLLEALEL